MEISKSKFSLYSSLGTNKMRRKHHLFTVEGVKAVSDMMKGFETEALIQVKGYHSDIPISPDMPLYEVTEESMRKLSNLSTASGVMGVFKIPENNAQVPTGLKNDLFMVLDGVQDPGNLGTIIRTCHWFGIYTIFASKDTVDIYNPKTVQATMGSLAKVKVIYCDLPSLFESNTELPVYGMMLDGEDIFKATLEKRGFILMGNEGKGISEGIKKYITHPLLIPPGGKDHSESLNVAIAAAITIAQFAGS